MAENRVIGVNGKLPWHIKEDLLHFKKITTHHSILMGRKTFESLGKPLSHRLNVVLTHQKNFKHKGVVTFNELNQALEFCQNQSQIYGDEIFVIGGSELYSLTLSLTQKIYMTLVHQNYNGDTFYPPINLNEFNLKFHERHEGTPAFSFMHYERKLHAYKD